MKKNHQVFSSDPLRITLPTRWSELTQKQFRAICTLMAADIPTYTIDTLLLLRLAHIRFIGLADYPVSSATSDFNPESMTMTRHVEYTPAHAIIRHRRRIYMIRATDLAAATQTIAWIHHVAPLRELAPYMAAVHRSARDITLRDLNFADFLAADSALQAYLATQDAAHTLRLVRILWPKLRHRRIRPWHHTAAIIWISAFKQHIQSQYPNLFAPAAPGDIFGAGPQDIRTAINTQIRALTKGDVTAEERVLAVPCHRALRELDELAREYQELKSI